MTTNTSDFWYRAARHIHEKDARDYYNRLARIASKYSYVFHILIFQSPDDSLYYTVAAGNLSRQARREVQQFFSGSSVTLSQKNLAFALERIAEQHQRNGDRERMRPDKPGVAQTHSSAQADQNFYEKKERLLRRVQEGTATQAQEDWLKRRGFLGQPKPQRNPEPQSLNPTYPGRPTKTGPVYRYRGPMKVTPVPGTGASLPPQKSARRKNRRKHRSVWVKYQTMRN